MPDPHDDRRAAVGDRHRRHGPARAAQRAGDERPRRRSRRRLHHAAARQDRHHHLGNRQAAEFIPVPASTRRELAEAAQLSSAWPTRRPKAARSSTLAEERLRPRRRERLPNAELVPFTAQTRMSGVDIEQRPSDPQGRGRLGAPLGAGTGRRRPAEVLDLIVDGIARDGGTPLVVVDRRRRQRPRARRDPPQGHRQAGHERALRRAAARWASARS